LRLRGALKLIYVPAEPALPIAKSAAPNTFRTYGMQDMTGEKKTASAKPAFQWDDPLLLETQLAEDERMVRDAARTYAQEKLLPRVQEAFRHEKTDPAIFREMGELGLLGATIPETYGGAG
jgi:glutaryl-CoA dehydrogenase